MIITNPFFLSSRGLSNISGDVVLIIFSLSRNSWFLTKVLFWKAGRGCSQFNSRSIETKPLVDVRPWHLYKWSILSNDIWVYVLSIWKQCSYRGAGYKTGAESTFASLSLYIQWYDVPLLYLWIGAINVVNEVYVDYFWNLLVRVTITIRS